MLCTSTRVPVRPVPPMIRVYTHTQTLKWSKTKFDLLVEQEKSSESLPWLLFLNPFRIDSVGWAARKNSIQIGYPMYSSILEYRGTLKLP